MTQHTETPGKLTQPMNRLRTEYAGDVQCLINEAQRRAQAERDRRMSDFPRNQEPLRQQYLAMLGWPLTEPGFQPSAATWTRVDGCAQAEIYLTQLEALPGLRFGGLFFKNRQAGALPLVICQHGGGGTPELCSGLENDGDTVNYHHMTERVLARGVHVFAPQLLLWTWSSLTARMSSAARKRRSTC